ncbi:hypothetical protein E3N88_20468 [Mikania micrantha]|uniref:Uncharacterized protein n=1 Tax=Mikania micrantha TaxID=192012 RepID=A0A5N6NJP3_9ASTR|nr:hypothetical protein E3N88_20468 [Mikania micrantha]
MNLGLLGSTETHRGTRWAPKWAIAVREAWAGEFEFSENHRGTRRPIICHHRVDSSLPRAVPEVAQAPFRDLKLWKVVSIVNNA